jgi:HK97 gp10 family phage protein
MTVFSLLEAAAHFKHLAHDWPKAQEAALAVAAQIVAAKAKSYIGTYTLPWPPLAASTLERKSADTPLLETGELRDSIQWKVVSPVEAHVGSDNQKAVWQELGTSRIPPRPFLGPAVFQNEALIKKAVREVVRDYMTQSRMDFDFTKAAIHALHKVWDAYKELGSELSGGDDSKSRRRR